MPGFLSSNTSMTICNAGKHMPLDIEKLRNGAFSTTIDPEGKRFGWTGLDDMLDTQNFLLAGEDPRFAGFSYRLDSRNPSGAVVRLQLAEKIRDEEAKGRKVGNKRKKDLKEEIIAKLSSQAEFAPSLTDCLWDAEKGKMYVSATGEKILERVLAHFKGCFGIDIAPIDPHADMSSIFSRLQRDNCIEAAGWQLQPMGSASLLSGASDTEKKAVAAVNNPEAIADALNQGLTISKIGLVATNTADEENQIYFSLDTNLNVSGLRLPKAEKGAHKEAVFLINADICASVGEIVEYLSNME